MSAGPVIWVDGRLLPAAGPHLSARDRGFTLGDGLFETPRLRRGRVLHGERHLARLRAGAAVLGLTLPWAEADLLAALAATATANGLTEAAVRLTVSRGVPGARGLLPDPAAAPTVVIDAVPFAGYPADLYARGARAITSTIRRNEHSPLATLKSLNYLDNILARRQAAAAGADEALLLNTAGRYAGASAANLFLIDARGLVTPPPAAGALPGITRALVLERLAAAVGLPTVEAAITPAALRAADEAFLTNALLGILPLTVVDGRPIGAGRSGPLTGRLGAALAALAAEATP